MIRSSLGLILILSMPHAAQAVDSRIAAACVRDYLSYCSVHDPDGPAVRKCFRAHGNNLSSRCVNALVAAGEVSPAEVARKSSRR